MPRLTIDGRCVEVPAGATILDAASSLGIQVPTLCHVPGKPAGTSCMVCVVKVAGKAGMVPSCAAPAEDGMVVDASSPQVLLARRTALELLLSDHAGDCEAPCRLGCPAGMDIAAMIRAIRGGQLRQAIEIVKRDIVLPATLGRVCPAPCEKACRRGRADEPVAICLLKRFVADADLASPQPFVPAQAAPSGRRVAIVGAGPAGLAAAWRLLASGHVVEVFDHRDRAGGMLTQGPDQSVLPPQVLEAEAVVVRSAGALFHMGTGAGPGGLSIEELTRDFDAVLLATGHDSAGGAELGLTVDERGCIVADRQTWRTPLAKVFAAGAARTGPSRLAIRSMADGKAAADAIHRQLTDAEEQPAMFNSRLGALRPRELESLLADCDRGLRTQAMPGQGLSTEEAFSEAARCMKCDCRKSESCGLRELATACCARPIGVSLTRPSVQIVSDHPQLVYEPSKCIRCGICIGIAGESGDRPGLAFIGRGCDVRVGVPFGGPLATAISDVTARLCAASCPTAAMSLK